MAAGGHIHFPSVLALSQSPVHVLDHVPVSAAAAVAHTDAVNAAPVFSSSSPAHAVPSPDLLFQFLLQFLLQ